MSAQSPRLTFQSLQILRVLIESRGYTATGADVIKDTHLFSGTVYPALARFEEAGWLKGEWEKIDPSREGRPRRRFYRLTGLGQRVARESFEQILPAFGTKPGWA